MLYFSYRSPAARPRGAFKIPPPRIFNDRSEIYSQIISSDEERSQYVADSFLVTGSDDENAEEGNDNDITECPLERAERLIRERQKNKKKNYKYH